MVLITLHGPLSCNFCAVVYIAWSRGILEGYEIEVKKGIALFPNCKYTLSLS